MKSFLLSCLASLLAVAVAHADEVRLKDGRVLVGKVTKVHDILEIQTRDGTVRVPSSEVAEQRTDEQLRHELADQARRIGNSPLAHLQLAAQARSWGLDAELWQHLGQAVQVPRTPDQEALRARVDDFLGQLEPDLLPRRLRTAITALRVHELLARDIDARGTVDRAHRAAVLELLRREANAEKELRTEARRNADAGRRLLALEALGLRGGPGSDAFTWRTAILDIDPRVRSQSLDVARELGMTTGVVEYLAPGLMHNSAEVRVRTAEAYEHLGDAKAMKFLVAAGPNAGKALAAADDGVRANIAILNQQAYIRDFDVEVAQAAFIADPKIGVLQSGVVLDVTVNGIFEQQVRIFRAYRAALQRLGGSDPGPNARDWATWLARLQAQPPAPTTATTPAPQTAPQKRL
jgi:hypothetical protein